MTDRLELASHKPQHFSGGERLHDKDRKCPYLSSVSFIKVVPRVEKTIKDILSCGLERKRNSMRVTGQWQASSFQGFPACFPPAATTAEDPQPKGDPKLVLSVFSQLRIRHRVPEEELILSFWRLLLN